MITFYERKIMIESPKKVKDLSDTDLDKVTVNSFVFEQFVSCIGKRTMLKQPNLYNIVWAVWVLIEKTDSIVFWKLKDW